MSSGVPLVVCGDETRRKRLVGILAEAGWRGVLSTSGLSEAANLLHHLPKACVIIDADLVDISGGQAVRLLRTRYPTLKIIFTTPENTRDLEAEVRTLDVFYYYISSPDKVELVEAVKDAIGAPQRGQADRPPKVLIVDDDPDFHAFVRAVLEPAGYATVSAHSEREGIDHARRERPDAILLDIIMTSTTDGFEFCHEVRRDPLLKHTPILGVSAIEERITLRVPPDSDPGLFPVDGYLRKPVAPEQLFAELKRLIPGEG